MTAARTERVVQSCVIVPLYLRAFAVGHFRSVVMRWSAACYLLSPAESATSPVVIVHDDRFDGTDSVTICALTTDPTEAPLIRLSIGPDQSKGLRDPSSLMIDKITTVPRSRLKEQIGRLGDDDKVRLNRAVLVILGLGGGPCGDHRRPDR